MSDLRQISIQVPADLFQRLEASGSLSPEGLWRLVDAYEALDATANGKSLGEQTNAWLRTRAYRDGVDLASANNKLEILNAMKESYFP